jgi:hypothetical protein
MVLKQVFEYSGKRIIVYDNVFTARENLDIYEQVLNISFTRSNVDIVFLNNRDVDAKWRGDIHPNHPLHKITSERYIQVIDELNWQGAVINHQYVNYSNPCTVDVVHTDCHTSQQNIYTIIHYANYAWDVNWHGETLFYNDECSEVIYSSLIKPGRVILFDSLIPHSATPPSSLAGNARYTIASKLFLMNRTNNEC